MADLPVFQDSTGRRWMVVKIIFFLLTISFIGFVFFIFPSIFNTQPVQPFVHSTAPIGAVPTNYSEPSIESIADAMSARNTPVIGKGPLVRVVGLKSEGKKITAKDPFSGQLLYELNETDRLKASGYSYALERYGATTGGKRIALTFDDGPDPVYTGKILDALSRGGAQSTFFVVGTNVAKHPELAQRILREGHGIANHTLTHAHIKGLAYLASTSEINLTQRIIRDTTSSESSFFRLPYAGNTDQSFRDAAEGILWSQHMGYTMTSYHYDTNDWKHGPDDPIKLPPLDGSDMVMLVHDSGGDRTYTVRYIEELIKTATAAGYRFVNLEELYPQNPSLVAPVAPTLADKTTVTVTQAVTTWPVQLVSYVFVVTVWSIVLTLIINVTLAIIQIKRSHYKRRARYFTPKVTIIVPAYNEGKVLIPTVRSLLRSRYDNIEVLIVDDGSSDDTWKVAKNLAAAHEKVRAVHQKNGGKAAALNNGIRKSEGEIIIGVDADTMFLPSTVTRLVRHFTDPKVGGVAGMVKVGNVKNLLTTWQALEYTIGINIERNAQALMGAILIIPGACGAWRKSALEHIGGYSTATLAEDCDATLNLHRAGYKIIQDNSALAYTEAPEQAAPFIKQRFRWTFGSIQAFWKHRRLFFNHNYGWTGMFALPNATIAIIMPIVFMPLMLTVAIENILAGRYYVIVMFLVVTLTLNFIVAFIAILLAHEKRRYLLGIFYARFVYGPIRIYVLYRTVLTVMKGAYVGWNKLQRTGTVRMPVAAKRTPQQTNLEPKAVDH